MNHKKVLFLVAFIAILIAAIEGQTSPEYKILFEKAKFTMETKGDLNGAISLFNDIIKKYPKEREYAAKSQLYIGLCYEKLGNAEARKAYESVVRDYADQTETTKVARERLSALTGGAGGTATKSTEVVMRRIWVAGKDLPICISPDGQYVVFRVYDSGNLWLRDLQSGEQRQITREGSRVESTLASTSGAISPDGKWIAYGWWNKGYEELRLSKLDGSSMRILCNGQDGRSMDVRAWMPDGRQILAVSLGKDLAYQPQLISLSDGSVRNIGQPAPADERWGFPSPDGRYIAYSLNGDIFVYDTMIELDSVLVKNPAADNIVGWTPEGSGILFVSDRSGSRDLYLLGIRNGRPLGELQMLRRDLGDAWDLCLTRDGRLFQIGNKGTYDSFIVPVDKQTGKLTGTPSLVDPNYPMVNFPAWSPDGKLLYYSINKGPAGNRSQVLVIRSEETGQMREITPKPKLPFWALPIQSLDGQVVVTGADENGNFGVFTINSESGDVSQLIKTPPDNNPVDPSPNWSPDGKAIFYKFRSHDKSEEFIIRRKDLTTGEEKDIHRGIYTREMKISPDGTRFAYFRNDGPTKSYVLSILDIQSGKELELWRVPGADSPGGITGPIWSPDGKHLLVAISPKQGTELWRFPEAGGPGEKIYFSPEWTWGFVLHPSGKRMAFTQSRPNSELWVLENFLPK
jgi:Tol biopolymer transport system component